MYIPVIIKNSIINDNKCFIFYAFISCTQTQNRLTNPETLINRYVKYSYLDKSNILL